MPDDTRQHNNEGVDHALDERERYHVAIRHMTDLVAEHRLDLSALHAAQQSGAHRHQRVIAVHAGGKGIHLRGVEDRHLRHADAGLLGLTAHSFDQPLLGLVLRLLNDPRTHRALRHPLGNSERDKRAAHAQDGGHNQQAAHVHSAGLCQHPVDPEQLEGNAQHKQHGKVGPQK